MYLKIMRRKGLCFPVLTTLLFSFSITAVAQDPLSIGTRNEFNFDFDGPVLETEGDLLATSVSATLSGTDLPAALVSQGVLTVTLEAKSVGGNVSADRGSFVEARGIGVASLTDNTNALRSDLNDGEALTLELSSTGAVESLLYGLELSGTRGSFPFNTVELTGATVNGASLLNTETSLEDFTFLLFDTPVTNVTVASTGDDGFRIKGVYLTTIPEPTSLVLLFAASCTLIGLRR